eukprot:TRINITY_DN26083_c0_g1_i1.p1 TRINITY_DN26083_c0_g1~~TRINITY_DN26083_c0_g1_i1.p1  ORF type:complete len:387 (+),score=134.93 TRINITY_DN26083_c0_g1_i1:1187-2347(+)
MMSFGRKQTMRPGMKVLLFLVLLSLVMWTGSHAMLANVAREGREHRGHGVEVRRTKMEKEVDEETVPPQASYQPWLNRKKYSLKDAGPAHSIEEKDIGLVTFVGNDKYVDGALVLGYSAGKTAGCGVGKWCRTGVLATQKISEDNLQRMAKVFDDVVMVNKSLSHTVAKTPWGSTFDKFYLWALTRYKAIIFYDADMVITASSTSVLRSVKLPSDHHWLAALGSSKGGYFATGTMVLRPNTTVLTDLLRFYDAVRTNKTDKWGFRGPNARDGLVMRYFIAGRVVPLKSLPAHHLSGSWKPWYNSHGDQSEVKDLAKFLKDHPKEDKPATRAWWEAYEALHKERFADDPDEVAAWDKKWGTEISPKTHVWMLRSTKWEYTQEIGGWQ